MPITVVNGVKINYEEYGTGEPVLLITGSGGRGRGWTPHQVPALTAAGYRVITVDNRGVPPSDVGPSGFTVDDMANDTAELIEALQIAPCRIVGYSLGGIIVQEVLVKRPELIRRAVLMASRGRTDVFRAAMSSTSIEFDKTGIELPPGYAAAVRASQYLSPRTLNDEQRIRDWLDMFEMSPPEVAINLAQQGLDLIGNRLESYRQIQVECLVIGFQDDMIVPAFMSREVSECIPTASYREIPGCGHYGHLEEPEAVNSMIIEFFKGTEARA